MGETTDNAFLGGALQLLQPARGYRAGLDPVLLAAACAPKPGASVLDLGCGVGTALYCLARRVPDLELTGVELQPGLAELARENATRNGLTARIECADIAALPAELRNRSFDLVLANPPFFERDKSTGAKILNRETGRGEALPLAAWVEVAAKRLKPGGQAAFIQRIERLPNLLQACQDRLGSVQVIPLTSRENRPPKLVILRARKGGRAHFFMSAPIVLHRGSQHVADEESYTEQVSAVLREGAALNAT
ncbi:tRNA1(Val) (adenine(37)-N6)-methyltransferase [Primorskyibacter sp. S187A]|uniref:tRNA1(Val) (adenine(37)-N6)-methyltransferase n=1 Tax=Primorskyibacter sp. S187A TaxID=3415130 RepID=UPI003C7B90D5